MSGLRWPAPYTSCLKLIFLISSHQSSHFSCHKGFLPNFMDHLPNPLLRATTHQRAQSRNLQNFPSPAGSFYPKPLKTASKDPAGSFYPKPLKTASQGPFPQCCSPGNTGISITPACLSVQWTQNFRKNSCAYEILKSQTSSLFLKLFYYYYYFKVFSSLQLSHHLKFLLWMLHL